jgi:tetratricopeptide (TPR) repeat protein
VNEGSEQRRDRARRPSDDDRGRQRPGRPSGAGRSGRGTPPSDARSGPGAAAEPIGRDRARTRSDAPPRRGRERQAPRRPDLPSDEAPQLPRGVEREIRRTLGAGPRADDVALALSIGSAAIDDGRVDVALETLAWAKHQAGRIATIREAYGVALYLDEDYGAALTELQAYRRMTGRVDQNHLIADCLRALDRDVDQVAAAAEASVQDLSVPEDRRAEAVIVWASALADAGDVASARAILRRFLGRQRSGDADHDVRVRYVAAELAERDGDRDEALAQLRSIAAVAPDAFDVRERLAAFEP